MSLDKLSRNEIFKTESSILEDELYRSKPKNDFRRVMTFLNIIGLGNMNKNERDELLRIIHLENKNKLSEIVDFKMLKSAYDICVKKQKETKSYLYDRTPSEHKFFQLIKLYTKKRLYHSYTFGCWTFDGYTPSLGLAFEVDGGIHNNELKMRKDELKYDQAQQLGIKIYSLENYVKEDRYSKKFNQSVFDFTKSINKIPVLNSRKRANLLIKIWIYSIVAIDLDIALDIFSIDKQTFEACTSYLNTLRVRHGEKVMLKCHEVYHPIIRY